MQKNVSGPSCNLRMVVSPENSMIYVYRDKPSFHKINIYSCSYIDQIIYCGDLKNCNNIIYGELGSYFIMEDGILFIPKKYINKNLEVLKFVVNDTCGDKVNLTVPFFMESYIKNKREVPKG